MGIDIYVDEIHKANRAKYEGLFLEAVRRRDKAPSEAVQQTIQKQVSTAYDAMYAVGYLRESYHGGPYVTRYLVGEAFEAEDGEATIPAAVLRERLPNAVMLAIYRDHIVYGEAETPPGEIITQESDDLSGLAKALGGIFGPDGEIEQAKSGAEGAEILARVTPEQREQTVKLIASGAMRNGPAQQFIAFVEQCEAREAETGKPCVVRASY